MVIDTDHRDLGACLQVGEVPQVGFDQHPARLVECLQVGTREDRARETASGAVLLHFGHLRCPRLELAGREEDELTVLPLGEDTTVFETTAKTGGHDHPALPVETVEVRAKEHCFASPSVLMSLTPLLTGRVPL